MEREQAYDADTGALSSTVKPESDASLAPLSYAYRHGDGSAEILGAELTDAAQARVEIVESGEPLTLRVVVRFNQAVDNPVIGFLFRNSQHTPMGQTRKTTDGVWRVPGGEVIEVSFTFDCWLGVDQYTISLAVHSREGQAYDWLDAALFLRVTSLTLTEGIANLNARATVRHRAPSPATPALEHVTAGLISRV